MKLKQRFKRTFLIVQIFLILTLSASVALSAGLELWIPAVKQAYSQWCWAACSEMAIKYFGGYASQYDVVYYTFGGFSNQPGTLDQTTRAINHFQSQKTSTWLASSFSFYGVQNEINNRRPILPRWEWKSSPGTGHLLVIRGWDNNNGNRVNYNDPWYGQAYVVSYDWFLENSAHKWSHTIYFR